MFEGIERHALTCVNDAGCTGDALSKRAQGETIQAINNTFPHWFTDKYKDYNGRDENLPFDQHQLVSLVAPRLLATASASEDSWADPEGQFHSLVFAQPVFALYGKTTTTWQTEDAPDRSGTSVVMRNGNIQHHMRAGGHDLKVEDWNNYLDFADCEFIHPPEKRIVGERLAYWALSKDYNFEGIAFSGPVYNEFEITKDGKIDLYFDQCPNGLSGFGAPLSGFEIAGEDKEFYPATATINENGTVTVFAEKVSNPVAVRYCFIHCPKGTLFNIEGLPASPFRTDDWQDEN